MSRAGVDPSGTILRAYLDSDCYFDIVDDSDALLSPKYHLVYAVGNKKSLEGQWMFFLIPFEKLLTEAFFSEKLHTFYAKQQWLVDTPLMQPYPILQEEISHMQINKASQKDLRNSRSYLWPK